MLKTEGQNWIANLRMKWITFHLIAVVAGSLGIATLLSAITIYYFPYEYWIIIPFFLVILIFTFVFKPIWKISATDISRYVNNKYPELEESADLLLKDREELSLLQQLQLKKIEATLFKLPQPKELFKKLYMGFGLLTIGLLLSFGVSKIPPLASLQNELAEPVLTRQVIENVLPQISDFSLTIHPPAYTGKAESIQKQFSVKPEAGARIDWKITTNIGVKKLKIIFNDKETITLKASDRTSTSWTYSKTINQAGFYQLELDGKKSDLYQIVIIPDLPVHISISQPKQKTVIDIGQPQQFTLKANLTDDYGVSDAFISATMASGKGEGVSFTEKKMPLHTSFNNKKNNSVTQLIDLKTLGMKPGDELYFFIKAMDNHGQSSRSDMYFVSIVDTTELMSLAGMTTGVNLVPEYFRSQRQIIIDTEKLLKEQNTITIETFKTRSNNLGIDQKLLRLRYGQFLGEESETEIGGDHDDHNDKDGQKETGEKFGDVTAIMDKYAHKHDVAEDATFFEPEMKAQLKAVLSEMWTSELRLRTYKPQEALPYAYKALRLLKDLQQKSRAYVAKTTVKTASLKPEKRLSGELDKIMQPVQQMNMEQKEERNTLLKSTLSLLELRKGGKKFTAEDKFMLSQAEKYMIGSVADQPATYLVALGSLRKLATTNASKRQDIELVQRAIQKMLKFETAKPLSKSSLPASTLYQRYYDQLTQSNR